MTKYDHWEQVYKEHAPEELPWELGHPRRELVDLFEKGQVSPEGMALDLCCGLGSNTLYLAQQGFRTFAIDISTTALTHTGKKVSDLGLKIPVAAANSVDIPFASSQFAFILDIGCFHHIQPEDRDKFVHGVHRILDDRGLYFMMCFSNMNGPAWNHFTEDAIEIIFCRLFDIIHIKHIESVEGTGHHRYFYKTLMMKN